MPTGQYVSTPQNSLKYDLHAETLWIRCHLRCPCFVIYMR